jgi:hypothetical protein
MLIKLQKTLEYRNRFEHIGISFFYFDQHFSFIVLIRGIDPKPKYDSLIGFYAFFIFMCIAMTVGIITVRLTYKKKISKLFLSIRENIFLKYKTIV